ncbi:SRPBCC family protein [Cohnella silvisoli]|uniref:SRPBCC family protein n=1 Tax=Cohnella silvisoli TaxID=2873699 RepID=A0ABV1KQD5_9BACL|nr:SRPBCC family protein [Cohnella silvisoli]MCD9022032.1 SRPBCC family protein [Cohnella silvisoli]
MWEFEHTVTTTAKAETIWKLYSDITSWVEWDKGIEYASLDGAFAAGTRGILQPEGQERLAFELTEVEPLRGFSDVTDIPDAGIRIRFVHRLQQAAEGTSVTHHVTITGPNAHQIGAGMAQGIPHTIEGLVALALEKERQYAG